jgi:hypothetical protein
MIQTDKYKKGVIALTLKAANLNPLLGSYQAHFLSERGRFIVQLSNGQIEIDISVARDYEQDSPLLHEGKLHQAAFSYQEEDRVYKATPTVDQAWRKLFSADRKKML